MNILVTGIAGYIGSICAEELVRRGHTVLGVDDLSEGHRAAVPPPAIFYPVNLGNDTELNRLFREQRVDAVMHFAALSKVGQSMKNPVPYFSVNIAHGVTLLNAMVRHRVRRMIFSSSAAVYGDPDKTPITEEAPAVPVNPYGFTKLIFEDLLEGYKRYCGLNYVSLRYFNAAGATAERGEDHIEETHIVPLLLEACQNPEGTFQVYGNDYDTPDGTCIRDYVHVQDLAVAHVLALENLDRLPGGRYNLGNNRGYSVLEVIESVRRVTRRPLRTEIAPRRAGDPAILVASSEKVRRDLGWEPAFPDLDSMVESAWQWKQKHPGGYRGSSGAD